MISHSISNFTPGKRLTEVLHHARGPEFAATLIRQLAPALVLLQQHGAGISHGVLSPDRIVVSRGGRLTIVEHVVGPAIDTLNLPPAKLQSMGIALPPASGGTTPRLDVATDWYQLGLVALSVLIGRPVSAGELPQLESLLDGLVNSARPDGLVLSPLVRQWLDRALQISGSRIESGADARAALDELLHQERSRDSRRLESLPVESGEEASPVVVTTEHSTSDEESRLRPAAISADGSALALFDEETSPAETRHTDPVSGATNPGSPAMTPPVLLEPAAVTRPELREAAAATRPHPPQPAAAPLRDLPELLAARPHLSEPAAAIRPPLPEPPATSPPVAHDPHAVTGHGLYDPHAATRPRPHDLHLATPPSAHKAHGATLLPFHDTHAATRPGLPDRQPATGRPLVDPHEATRPRPLKVGRWRVSTAMVAALVLIATMETGVIALMARALWFRPEPPLAVETAASGENVLVSSRSTEAPPIKLIVAPDLRWVRVTTPSDRAFAGKVTDSATGTIRISSPIELKVFERSRLVGSVPGDGLKLSAGRHDIELVNGPLGYRLRQAVEVKAGETVSIHVAPPDGSVTIDASPWAEVTIDGRAAGRTPLGPLALTPGEYEVAFRNPAGGNDRQRVTVRPEAKLRVVGKLRR